MKNLWEEGNVPDFRHSDCPLEWLYVAAVAENCAYRAG